MKEPKRIRMLIDGLRFSCTTYDQAVRVLRLRSFDKTTTNGEYMRVVERRARKFLRQTVRIGSPREFIRDIIKLSHGTILKDVLWGAGSREVR